MSRKFFFLQCIALRSDNDLHFCCFLLYRTEFVTQIDDFLFLTTSDGGDAQRCAKLVDRANALAHGHSDGAEALVSHVGRTVTGDDGTLVLISLLYKGVK